MAVEHDSPPPYQTRAGGHEFPLPHSMYRNREGNASKSRVPPAGAGEVRWYERASSMLRLRGAGTEPLQYLLGADVLDPQADALLAGPGLDQAGARHVDAGAGVLDQQHPEP